MDSETEFSREPWFRWCMPEGVSPRYERYPEFAELGDEPIYLDRPEPEEEIE